MNRTYIRNSIIVNEGRAFKGSLLIEDSLIAAVWKEGEEPALSSLGVPAENVIEAEGLHLLPGVIDTHVHFREPGDASRGTIESESIAAVLGGVTSFMDMPNNTPPAVTLSALEEKFASAARSSYANYSFYLGATNNNIEQIRSLDAARVCGVKVFMGASTGDLLVDEESSLEQIFRQAPALVATHCEDSAEIARNLRFYTANYRDMIPPEAHPLIRSEKACVASTRRAIALALKYGTRLHILHISTAKELELLSELKGNEQITAETCLHYLWFCSKDYPEYGNLIKCNPAIKEETDMLSLRRAVAEGVLRTVSTDHAPHPLENKLRPYKEAPSGIPLIQYSLQMLLELAAKGVFTLEQVVERASHEPARVFNVSKRGFIREGYHADLVLVNLRQPDSYSIAHPASRCGWSPFAGHKESFSSTIEYTIVNGTVIAHKGRLTGKRSSSRLLFGV